MSNTQDMHLNHHKCGGTADGIGILGTGSAFPEKVLTNEDLAEMMDTSDEWIRTRTGIGQRHIATEDTTSTLAIQAAQKALEMAGLTGADIDVIIMSSVTPDYRFPTGACLVQRAIDAYGAAAFDLSAACSGFIYAYSTAYKFLKSGGYRNALVIGSETLSRITNWEDRSTAVLFGDGAGAVVLGHKEGSGLLGEEIGADGGNAELIVCSDLNDWELRFQQKMDLETMSDTDPRKFLAPMEATATPYMTMAGREVYKFATTFVPASIERILEDAGLDKADVSKYILHQANARIIESAAKRLKDDREKFPMSIEENANTSSSTIPALLDRLVRNGEIRNGDKLVMSGFGAGLTWASVVLVW